MEKNQDPVRYLGTLSITGDINTDSRKGKSPESVEPASKGLDTPTGWAGGGGGGADPSS